MEYVTVITSESSRKSVISLVYAKGHFLSDRTAHDQYNLNTILTHININKNVDVSFKPD